MTKKQQSPSVFSSKSHMFPINQMQGYKYVTIVPASQGRTNQKVYFAQAPIMGIHIQQQVDYSMMKTLAGNFGLLTFQDHPVVINVSGIRNLAQNICDSNGARSSSAADVTDLYEQYKSSRKQSTQKILMNITIGQDTYKGVIIALQQRSMNQSDFPGIISYSLVLLGARA